MFNSFTAESRLFDAEEHVEICESHIHQKQARLPEYLARGDPVELARLMGLMHDLLTGFRERRALAAADVLQLGRA
jgi:hypothetical protein